MRIIFKKTPIVLEARTKAELASKVCSSFNCSWASWGSDFSNGFGYRTYARAPYGSCNGSEKVVAVNYEKRKKQVSIGKFVPSKIKPFMTRKRVIIKEGHWKAFVYVFPISMVKSFKQNKRNFQIGFNPL